MSQQLPIAYVNIRFCAHATEDPDKVMKAVQNILPNDQFEEITFKKNILEGHYGNPITFFETKITDKKTLKALIEKLSSNLSSTDKEELGRNLHLCAEKESIYLRLDKQAALQGKIKLVKADPIRMHIRFRKPKIENVTSILKKIGMLT